MKKIFSIILIILIVLGMITYFYIDNYIEKSLQAVDVNSDVNVSLEIPQGSSTNDIAQILKENNLIKDSLVFKYYAKKTGSDSQLKAGTFVLSKNMNVDEIINVLINGGTSGNTENITIIEGLTLQETAKSISEQMGLSYDKLLSLMENIGQYRNDYKFLMDNPEIKNLQGYLMPDTYNVYKTSTEEEIVKMLDALKLSAKTLIVTAESNENVYKSARNIEGIAVLPVNNINVYDLLKYEKLVITKDAVSKIEEVYA
jgi:UPF0755 protein